jgi:hypothetical protein
VAVTTQIRSWILLDQGRAMRDEFDLDEDEDDDLDDNDDELMPCPYCFATIYDDSERCPHCAQYLSKQELSCRPPWWILMGVSISLVIVARWIVRF